MKHLCLAFMVVMFSFPVLAQDNENLCRTIERFEHSTSGAAYQPGQDVRGHPVVPADLNERQIAPPQRVRFPLTVDLARYINQDVPRGIEMDSNLGMVEVDIETGKVYYNGQPVTDNLVAYCDQDKESE